MSRIGTEKGAFKTAFPAVLGKVIATYPDQSPVLASLPIPSPPLPSLPTLLASLHSLLLHLRQVAECSVPCPFLTDIACHYVSFCRSLIFLPPPSFLFPSATGESTCDPEVFVIAWCCFYYFARNSLVALLEALCARIFFFRFVNIGFFLTFFFLCVCVQGL